MKRVSIGVVMLFVLLITPELKSQVFSLNECIDYALKNNENIKMTDLNIKYQGYLKKASSEIPKTTVMYTQGQFNSIYKYDNNITVSQSLPFPSVLSNSNKLHSENIKSARYNSEAAKADLIYQIKTTYYSLLYTQALHELLYKEDSIYVDFANVIQKKFIAGESSLLEKTGTETQVMEIKNQLLENEEDALNYRIQLQTLMNYPKEINIKMNGNTDLALSVSADTCMNPNHPLLNYYKQQTAIMDKTRKYEFSKTLPDITLGYFNQTIYGPANVFGEDYFLTTKNRLQGFQIGMTLPIWYYPMKEKINSLKINTEIAETNFNYNKTLMDGHYHQALVQYSKYQNSLTYYKTNALTNSGILINQALESYKKKEIGYVEYLQIVSQALDIECNYLRVLHQNNLTVLKLQYLLGN